MTFDSFLLCLLKTKSLKYYYHELVSQFQIQNEEKSNPKKIKLNGAFYYEIILSENI